MVRTQIKTLRVKTSLLFLKTHVSGRSRYYLTIMFFRWINRRPRRLLVSGSDVASKITLVSMLKGFEDNFHDWLVFHKYTGVSKFVIYVNASDVSEAKIYAEIVNDCSFLSGLVDVVLWPNVPFARVGSRFNVSRRRPSTQELAFMHFDRNYKKLTSYYTKLDGDEYLFVPMEDPQPDRLQFLLTFSGMRRIEGYNFGSSGHKFPAMQQIPCAYTWRAEKREHTKSICQASTCFEIFNAHIAGTLDKDEIGIDGLQLNHYKLLSEFEFKSKKVTNVGYMQGDYMVSDFEELDLSYSSEFDISACRQMQKAADFASNSGCKCR